MVWSTTRLVASAAVLLQLLFSQAEASPLLRRQSLNPNDDPFYTVPSNINDYQPGDRIGDARPVLTKINAPGSSSYQILFRTNGKDGEATATVATVWEPAFKALNPPQIFAYQFAEDADNLDCNPSWAWVQGSGSKAQIPEKDIQGPALIPWALNQGYYVVSTDAEGPKSAWLVGKIEGQSVIDAIKAAKSFYNLASPRVALYGYSGGAHTTAWAATIAASTNTGLDIVGAAFGGTPIDLGAAFDKLNNSPQSLLAGAALFGLANGYSELNDELNRLLTPEGQQLAADLRSRGNCSQTAGGNIFSGGTSFDYNSIFNGGNILANPVLQSVLQQENLLASGVAVPTFPRLQYHGTDDKTVPFQPEQDYVNQQCASGQGARIGFVPFQGQDHAATAILGIPGALGFLKAALGGTPIVPNCGTGVDMPALGSSNSINILGQDLDSYLQSLV